MTQYNQDLISLANQDLERYESLAQRPVEPLTEILSVRISSNLHRVLQKLVSREDLPFASTSDLARYSIAVVAHKLADLVGDGDITLVTGQVKVMADRAMEQKVMSQWTEIVEAIKTNLQSAVTDLDTDAIADTMDSAINLVSMIRSKVWQARLARVLAREDVVQGAIMWLWVQWGEQGVPDPITKERARQLTKWLEGAIQ